MTRAALPLSTFLLFTLAMPAARAQQLVEVPVPNMGGKCDDLDPNALADAIEHEIPILQRSSQKWTIGNVTLSTADYATKTLAPLAQAARRGSQGLCQALATRFRFFRNAGVGAGTFTAYHNPIIRASRTKQGPYQFPLYHRPPGALANLTTAQVLAGGLVGKGLEFLWLADATEVLAVHVEGSALVQLDDGSMISIGSDGHNGHPYQNVSKLVLAAGVIPKNQQTPVGMTRARKYFLDHPDELNKYWSKNPHYVFFKEKQGIGGSKFGALTPGRSLAIDPVFIPQGAAVWFRSDMPAIVDNKIASWVSYGRVALGQDTGAGIKGAGRVDVFFGTGEYAQQASAVTTRPGEIYVLLAK